MSTEKAPQYRTRAPKQLQPRERIVIYLPKSEVTELDQLAERTSRSRSSIITERYNAGKAAQEG